MEIVDSPKKEVVVNELINHALSEVERKYGKGEGDGGIPKSYHNRIHTQDVVDASENIAQLALTAGKIQTSDIPLIKIAASFHDIEQDLGGGLNEKESARLAEEEMRKTGIFGDDDIRKVKEMIMATIVFFENGVMKQSATQDYLTQVITDADLANLGKKPDAFWEKAKRLLKEMKKTDNLSREDELAFAKTEIPFLEHHKFYTPEADILFSHKQENIEFVKEHIKLLEGKTN